MKTSFAPHTVITSRVARYLDNPDKISPVSCTMVSVEDTYYDIEGDYSFYETISGSRVYVTKVLKGNAGVLVDLSKLRPKGTLGSNGLEAQGATNFLAVYSAINAEVRRGNGFKNGAVVLCLNYDHADLIDFINFPKSEIPWAKRAITLDPETFSLSPIEKRQAVYDALARGDIFVAKDQYDMKGRYLFPNVCMGLSFISRSTCTLAHVNLGKVVSPSHIPDMMMKSAEDLNQIWEIFKANRLDHFIDPELDKQVGLGFVGLANLLANFSVKYEEFVNSLEKITDGELELISMDLISDRIAYYLYSGYVKVGEYARSKGYSRFIAIEPTASCSYKEFDMHGYTCTPEISPPVCHPETKITRRQTADGYVDYQYPLNVETAGHDVPVEIYDRLCVCFQGLANMSQVAQGISYNWWLEKPVNEETFSAWLDSPLKTIYYRWKTSTIDQDKTSVGEEVEGAAEHWSTDYPDDEDIVTQSNDKLACTVCAG